MSQQSKLSSYFSGADTSPSISTITSSLVAVLVEDQVLI